MVEIQDGEDVRAIATPDLRLVFRWAGDRWTHSLEVRYPSGWEVVAEAVDSEPGHEDPSEVIGPVFQEIFPQRDGPSAEILAVGRSGSHYFSAVFRLSEQPLTSQPGTRSRLKVDVSDRSSLETIAGGSTYLVHARSPRNAPLRSGVAYWTRVEAGRDITAVLMSLDEDGRIDLGEGPRDAIRARVVGKRQPNPRWVYRWGVENLED